MANIVTALWLLCALLYSIVALLAVSKTALVGSYSKWPLLLPNLLKLTPVSRCTTPLSQASPVFDLLLFRSTRPFYTVVHLGLKLHVDVADYPVLIPSRTTVECKLASKGLGTRLENNRCCETKSGTESLGFKAKCKLCA